MLAQDKETLAAAAGADYLDKAHPGWRAWVYPHVLQVDDPDYCVLGQVERQCSGGTYYDYMRLRGPATDTAVGISWAVAHGFLVDYRCYTTEEQEHQAHDRLQHAWLLLLQQKEGEGEA